MSGGTALFGPSNARSQNKNLVEFKAGKMTQKGKLVHPDTRKGLLYVYQCKDSLMHFCWKDRQSLTIEDDLIIFPDDCEFKRVPQCTTGRVYVLKFKSSSKRFFFWIQEPKTDKDEENCRRLNEVLNNPPTPGSQRSGGVTPDGDFHNLLSNMSQQQLIQLFGGVGQMGGLSSLLGNLSGPSTSHSNRGGSGSSAASAAATTASSAAAASAASDDTPSTPVTSKGSSKTSSASNAGGSSKDASQNQIQLSDVRSFLSGLNIPSTAEEVDLSTALTVDSLQAMLGNPAVVQELQQHLPPLDESGNQQEQLRATLASPQFQQAVSMFSTALQSGQLGPVVQQFQVGDDAVQAANRGNMEDFVRALQRASISGTPASPASSPATAAPTGTPTPTPATPATPATPSAERSPSEPVHPEKKKKMDEKTPSGPPKKDDEEDEGMSMD